MKYSWRTKQIIPAEPGLRLVVIWPDDEKQTGCLHSVYPVVGWALREEIASTGDEGHAPTPTEETKVEALIVDVADEFTDEALILSEWVRHNLMDEYPYRVYRMLHPGEELKDADLAVVERTAKDLGWQWRHNQARIELERAMLGGRKVWQIRSEDPETVREYNEIQKRMDAWRKDNPHPHPPERAA